MHKIFSLFLVGIMLTSVLASTLIENPSRAFAQSAEIHNNNPISEQQIDDLMATYIITPPASPDTKSKKSNPDLKFNLGFKNKIDNMINAGETRLYNVILMVQKTPELKDNFNEKNNPILPDSVPVSVTAKQVAKINKDNAKRDLINIHGATNIYKAEVLSFVTASVPIQEISKLANYEYVVAIDDAEMKLTPLSLNMDDAKFNINSLDVPFDGSGVKVAVLDFGIRQDHPDLPLGTKIVDQVDCTSRTFCDPLGNFDDIINHGTHQAGIIAGLGTDASMKGIAPGALILNAKTTDVRGIAEALDWALMKNAKVANISLAGGSCNSPNIFHHVIDEAVDEGLVVVNAAGNSGPDPESITGIACSFNTITVGSIDDMDTRTKIDDVIWNNNPVNGGASSRGPTDFDLRLKPELVAPGVRINSTDFCNVNGNPYNLLNFFREGSCQSTSNPPPFGNITGTSHAAPFISGAAAILLEANPEYTPVEVKAALLLGADWTGNPVPLTASDYEQDPFQFTDTLNARGFGLLDVHESLTLTNSGKNIVLDSISQGDDLAYSFSAIQGEQIKVILSWLKHPGGTIITPEDSIVSNLDLVIKKPDGSTIISNSVNQNNEFAVFNAPITGAYTITVSAPIATPETAFKETFALASTHSLQQGSFLVKEGSVVKSVVSTLPQFARPTSDVTVGGWTTTSLYQKLNESSPDDTTFVTSPSGTAPQFEVSLGDVEDPESSADHIIKFRAMTSSGGRAPEQAHATLFQGNIPIATTNQNGPEKVSRTEFTEFRYTLTATEANSITDYNDLSIVISTSKGETETIQVSWIEFEVPPIPAVQTISGLGFQPKALILFTTGQTAEGTTDGYKFSIGYSNGISSRTVGISSDDALPSSNTGRAFGTKVLSILEDGTPTISAEADLINIGSNSFTIKWTTNDSIPSNIHYIALGGDALTDAQVSSFAAPTATGNQDVVVGFKPDFLMFMHAASTLETSEEKHGYVSYGFAKSPLSRGAIAVTSEDHRSSSDTWNLQRTDRAIIALDETSGNVDAESDLVSINESGFTLNWIDAPEDPDRIYYLALKGGGYDVGSFNKVVLSSPATQIVPSLVSFPKGLILSSVNNVATATVQPNNRLSFGASDGFSDSSIWVGDQDSMTNAITARSTSDSKIIQFATEDTTGNSSVIDAEADLQSFDTNTFMLNWTTNDPVTKQIIFVAFGNFDLNTGLVGHWILDENEGLVATDGSGKNNVGTLVNDPTWLSGSSCKENNCLNFNGVNSTVIVPDSLTLDGMDALTLSAYG